MAQFPCFPLFTDAYLGDTTHLTTIEHGAYLLLLMTQWRSPTCTLPNDDKMLARYCKLTMKEWMKIRPILEPFYQVTKLSWHQKRVGDERKYVEDKRKQNVSAGRSSALKRKDRHSTDVITDVPTEPPTEGQREPNQPTPLTLNPKDSKKEIEVHTGDFLETSNAFGVANVPQEILSHAVELWNHMARDNDLPTCQTFSDERKKSLRKRLKECGGIDGWKAALEKVSSSSFCKGGGKDGWILTFDFLLTKKGFTKLMEGNYDDRKSTGSQKLSSTEALFAGFAIADPHDPFSQK